jgi:predicted metal-dependent HD superfamily phosphohydrolase
VDQPDASEVAWLISLTKSHRAPDNALLGALLISIDLAILGAEPRVYREYAAAVRQEYAHLSDEAWRAGRAAVLERLLEADPLYPDADFRAQLEEPARRNMESELKALVSG